MKTIVTETNVYTFDELTDEAKENAIENFRNYTFEHGGLCWQTENANAVKVIAEKMGWKYDYSSWDGVDYCVEYSVDDGDVAELSGARAMAYIENNYIDVAKKPKMYWLHNVLYGDGRKNWTRKSKVNFTIDDCPFTGYCMDCCFSEAWREWKSKFNKHSTVQDFADMVASHLSKDWTEDNRYQVSDEGILEVIEANDYEFLEDGTFY